MGLLRRGQLLSDGVDVARRWFSVTDSCIRMAFVVLNPLHRSSYGDAALAVFVRALQPVSVLAGYNAGPWFD